MMCIFFLSSKKIIIRSEFNIDMSTYVQFYFDTTRQGFKKNRLLVVYRRL